MGKFYVVKLIDGLQYIQRICETAHEAVAEAVLLGHKTHHILDTDTDILYSVLDFIIKFV